MKAFADFLTALGEWLVVNLWPLSMELAVFGAMVFAVIYLFRIKSPVIRHLFWVLVLIKPVAALLVASPVSVYDAIPVTQVDPAVVQELVIDKRATPIVEHQADAVSDLKDEKYSGEALTVALSEEAVIPPVLSHVVEPGAELSFLGTIGLLWLLAALLLTLRLVVGFAYVSFLRQTSVMETSPDMLIALEEAKQLVNPRRRVHLAVSKIAHGPLLAGIFSATIILPEKAREELSLDHLKLIFVHELVHVSRWDNLSLLVQRVAEIIFFHNPVIWFCAWFLRKEAEDACDDAVMQATDNPLGYADSLTRVAEMRSPVSRRLLLNTFAAGESNFMHRIRRILVAAESPGRYPRMVGVVALLVIAFIGLPTSQFQLVSSEAPSGHPFDLSQPGRVTTNLIHNGDFEFGFEGFTTDYSFTDYDDGSIRVLSFSREGNWRWVPLYDHTTGTGRYVTIDGHLSGVKTAMATWVDVEPETFYAGGFWVGDVHLHGKKPAVLRVWINDEQAVSHLIKSNPGEWKCLTYLWYSGTNTKAQIQVTPDTGYGSMSGMDWAADDFFFAPIEGLPDQIYAVVCYMLGYLWSEDESELQFASDELLHKIDQSWISLVLLSSRSEPGVEEAAQGVLDRAAIIPPGDASQEEIEASWRRWGKQFE